MSSPSPQKCIEVELIDDSYTISIAETAQILGRSEEDVERLIEYSLLNARSGIEGPLTVFRKRNVTLRSALAYRRRTAVPHSS